MRQNVWQNELMGTCCSAESCSIPCVLFGQIRYRQKHPEDVLLKDFKWPSTFCCLYAVANLFLPLPLICISNCIQRGSVRQQLDIKGNACYDFCASCFAPCCTLAQGDHELRDWQDQKQAYTRTPQMTFEPQPVPTEPSDHQTSDVLEVPQPSLQRPEMMPTRHSLG